MCTYVGHTPLIENEPPPLYTSRLAMGLQSDHQVHGWMTLTTLPHHLVGPSQPQTDACCHPNGYKAAAYTHQFSAAENLDIHRGYICFLRNLV